MGKTTILGIAVGFGLILGGFMMDKGNLAALFLISPMMIVLGGTAGAILVSYSMDDVKKIFPLVKQSISEPPTSLERTMQTVLSLAAKAKREGLLVLEETVQDEEFIKKNDPLIVRGILLLMQGFAEDALLDILDQELYIFDQIKKKEISMFEAAGGFSPTMGIIGTVLGLIEVLANMTTASELAKSIATAFTATLYGIMTANLLYLPIANKLKLQYKLARIDKQLIIDGVISINNGYSPMEIKERLSSYLQYDEKPVSNGKGAEAKDKEEQPDA
jgi:Flagellar motor component